MSRKPTARFGFSLMSYAIDTCRGRLAAGVLVERAGTSMSHWLPLVPMSTDRDEARS